MPPAASSSTTNEPSPSPHQVAPLRPHHHHRRHLSSSLSLSGSRSTWAKRQDAESESLLSQLISHLYGTDINHPAHQAALERGLGRFHDKCIASVDENAVTRRLQGMVEKLLFHGRTQQSAQLKWLAQKLTHGAKLQGGETLQQGDALRLCYPFSVLSVLLELSYRPLDVRWKEIQAPSPPSLDTTSCFSPTTRSTTGRVTPQGGAPEPLLLEDDDVAASLKSWRREIAGESSDDERWGLEEDEEEEEAEGPASPPSPVTQPDTKQDEAPSGEPWTTPFFRSSWFPSDFGCESTSKLTSVVPHSNGSDALGGGCRVLHPCHLASVYVSNLISQGTTQGILPRYHYVDETEVVRAVLGLYRGVPGSFFQRPKPDQDYYELSPASRRLLCAHLTPSVIIAKLESVVWQANCLGYLREFVRRIEQGEDVGQGGAVGLVLEGFVEGLKGWLWEVGQVISEMDHRLYRAQAHADDNEASPAVTTLLGIVSHLRPILGPALGLSTLLRETVEIQAGQATRLRVWTGRFLSGMYHLVEREALLDSWSSNCLAVFVDLFFRSLRPYLRLIDRWVTEGPAKGLDPRQELMIQGEGGLLHMEAVPSFLHQLAEDIMVVGEEVEFLRRIQGEERRGSLAGRRVWVYKKGWRREKVNVRSRRRRRRDTSKTSPPTLPSSAAPPHALPTLAAQTNGGPVFQDDYHDEDLDDWLGLWKQDLSDEGCGDEQDDASAEATTPSIQLSLPVVDESTFISSLFSQHRPPHVTQTPVTATPGLSDLHRHPTFVAATPPPKVPLSGRLSAPLPFTLLQVDTLRGLSTARRTSRGSLCGTPRSTCSGTEAELTSLVTDDDRHSEAVDERGVLWEAHIMEPGDLESLSVPSHEACQGVPFQLVMDHCLLDKLSLHCQAVSRRCVARFFEPDGLNLQGYLVALDHLFLMSHKDLLTDFRAKVFNMLRDDFTLPTSAQATEWLQKSVVAASHLSTGDDLATAIFLQSFPGEDRPALESLRVEVIRDKSNDGDESETDLEEQEVEEEGRYHDYMEEQDQAVHGPRSPGHRGRDDEQQQQQSTSAGFHGLHLYWRFPWPLKMVISNSSIKTYARIARFLLEATYVKDLCQEVYYWNKAQYRTAKSTTAAAQLAALHFFSRGLHEYLSFQCAVTSGGVGAVIRRLKKAKNIRGMERCLASYVECLEEHCLLSPATKSLYVDLGILLDYVAQFCLAYQQQDQKSSHGGGQPLSPIYTSFLRRFRHTNVVMDQLITSRLAPYVEYLRVRLDFNAFFSRWDINDLQH